MREGLRQLIEQTLRHRLFAPVLREAPSLRGLWVGRVESTLDPRRHDVHVRAQFQGADERWVAVPEETIWRHGTAPGEFARNVHRTADCIWSESFEDALIERELPAKWRQVQQAEQGAYRAGMRAHNTTVIRHRFAQDLDHIRRNHPHVQVPDEIHRWRDDYMMSEAAEYRWAGEPTATELSMRERSRHGTYDWRTSTFTVGDAELRDPDWRNPSIAREAARRMARDFDRRAAELLWPDRFPWSNRMPDDRVDALRMGMLGDFAPGPDPVTKEAEAKGLQLLKENLTPAQRAQYEKHKHFDVKGGTSGKTYRVKHGRQQNVYELDRDGKEVCGWCFLPQGGLVAGDCMLAQKTALELFEAKALKIANKFPTGLAGSRADSVWIDDVPGPAREEVWLVDPVGWRC